MQLASQGDRPLPASHESGGWGAFLPLGLFPLLLLSQGVLVISLRRALLHTICREKPPLSSAQRPEPPAAHTGNEQSTGASGWDQAPSGPPSLQGLPHTVGGARRKRGGRHATYPRCEPGPQQGSQPAPPAGKAHPLSQWDPNEGGGGRSRKEQPRSRQDPGVYGPQLNLGSHKRGWAA